MEGSQGKAVMVRGDWRDGPGDYRPIVEAMKARGRLPVSTPRCPACHGSTGPARPAFLERALFHVRWLVTQPWRWLCRVLD